MAQRRRYGQDQPWREERRNRYPDERYGGGAEQPRRQFADDRQSHRGRGWEGNQDWRSDESRGANYRGDFSPEGEGYGERGSEGWGRGRGYGFGDNEERNERRTDRGWENFSRRQDAESWGARNQRQMSSWDRGRSGGGWNEGGSFGFGSADEDRGGTYGYGSPYGQGDMNSDRAGRGDWRSSERGEWRSSDRGNWPEHGQSGQWRDTDWMTNRPARGRGTWSGDWSQNRDWSMGQSNLDREDYTGRGPKDYRRSDDRIREEICDAFTDDWRLDASEVNIKVEGGEVTLSGNVGSRDQKRCAEEVAERISGVRDVINQLRVSRGDMNTTGGIRAPKVTK